MVLIWIYYSIWPSIFTPLIPYIAITSGTYLGVWVVGRVRKPSLIHGVLVSLISFLILRFYVIFRFFIKRGIPFNWIYTVKHVFSVDPFFIVELISSLVGGIVGTLIIRQHSPSYCPNCGKKLPPGCEPCPSCGTKV